MLDFIYDHFDAFKLIACCAGGTKYEHYLDTLAEIEDNAGRALIEKMAEAGYSLPQIDDELIHIMSSALFNGIFETVRHDMPREKALRYMASSGTSILPVGSNCWGSQTPEFPQFFD